MIRADGGADTGGGHVMRGLALADQVRAFGGSAHLAAISLDGPLRARALAHDVPVLSPTGAAEVGSSDDAAWLVGQAEALNIDWVVTDGYRFDADYQRALHDAGLRQLVIDDYGQCDRYCAEAVLNQNASARSDLYTRRAGHTQLLLGPAYALLRAEFAAAASVAKPLADRADKLLVTMGGADSDNVSARVVQALSQLDGAELRVRVLVGPSNRHAAALREQIDDPRISVIGASDDMASLMAWADLAISAAGSTTYELCCMGVPSLLVVLADNQRGVATSVSEAGAGINLGWHEQLEPAQLTMTVKRARQDMQMRRALAEQARALVDGKGSQRVVAALEAFTLDHDATEAGKPCAIESQTETSVPDIPHT